ncbi:hypothetical protein F0562_025692 [Nyssa sinensis]|uniref:Chromo domain-containing protein n=1 Tax=Nyssa sinensis TaxID=561372 RepID=A0A5J5B970_9ASTE|nr:hypothetical protein F0562_025692 [Nyssa sinensis]
MVEYSPPPPPPIGNLHPIENVFEMESFPTGDLESPRRPPPPSKVQERRQHHSPPRYYHDQPRHYQEDSRDITRKVKVDAPSFDGRLDSNTVLDWCATGASIPVLVPIVLVVPPHSIDQIDTILDDELITSPNGGYRRFLVKWCHQPDIDATWITEDELHHLDPNLLEQRLSFTSPEESSSLPRRSDGNHRHRVAELCLAKRCFIGSSPERSA